MAYRPDQAPVYQAIQDFVQRCLLSDRSLLWPERIAWTPANVAEVKRRLVGGPMFGKGRFEDKLAEQMRDASAEQWIIIADTFYVYYLPSSSITPNLKREKIAWACSQAGLPAPADSVWEAQTHGFTRTSQKYNFKYAQFWLILLLANEIKTRPDAADILGAPERLQAVLDQVLESVPNRTDRATDMRHALLYMLFPRQYERSISAGDKQAMIEYYGPRAPQPLPTDVDAALRVIREAIAPQYNTEGHDFDFYEPRMRREWKDEAEAEPEPPEGPVALAEPFSKLFRDAAEAEWAFDLLAETMGRLGIDDPADERYALTLPKYSGADAFLSLILGNWQVLSFWGRNRGHLKLSMTIIGEQTHLGLDTKRTLFRQQHQGMPVAIYRLPETAVRPLGGALEQAFQASLQLMAERFKDWERSSLRQFHIPELAAAVFDPEKRAELLTRGLAPRGQPEPNDLAISEASEVISDGHQAAAYPLEQFAADTGLELVLLERWKRAIQRKGQAILYGPPGTGKTYVAERLARHLTAGGDGLVELVQFHPGYAYEDFIQGLRPEPGVVGGLNFRLTPGRFLEFCERAAERQGLCVLIVDEINRANLSQVLGELMYLLEYRDREIPLAAGGVLRVPANVRVIGTMNTADRSIALVDHALRRRFAFLALYPNYEVLRRYHARTGYPVAGLVAVLEQLNRRIADRHYEIGPSFFLVRDLAGQIEDIWRMEIEPYLEEYFFDQPGVVDEFRWDKVRARITS